MMMSIRDGVYENRKKSGNIWQVDSPIKLNKIIFLKNMS